ncbi:MAG: type III-B CRISPR module-associated protein Cmr5 [Firmicutes bacterium]|nr:type III-B CRISPR module-associated protein Cmr5 [Bacillota bacterium]
MKIVKTLTQERAEYAYDKINQIRLKPQYSPAKVAMHLRRLPAMVLANGLGQTLAFLLADAGCDKNKPSYLVYDMLAQWLVAKRKLYEGQPHDLIYHLVSGNRVAYQRAQQEVWALLDWLRKFADAYLPSTETKGEGKL